MQIKTSFFFAFRSLSRTFAGENKKKTSKGIKRTNRADSGGAIRLLFSEAKGGDFTAVPLLFADLLHLSCGNINIMCTFAVRFQ